MTKKDSPFIKYEDWIVKAEEIEPILLKVIAQHKNEESLLKYLSEWGPIIRHAAFDYTQKDAYFEREAQIKERLSTVEKKFSAFKKEFSSLPSFSRLLLNNENDRNSYDDLEKTIDRIHNVLLKSLGDQERHQEKLKKDGFKETHDSRRPLDTLIKALLIAYTDITGNNIGLSYDPHNERPSGPLFRFILPFIEIFEPLIKHETLQDRIKIVRKQESLIQQKD